MVNPVSQIVAVLDGQTCRSRDSFEYALYLSLSIQDLCESYFTHFSNTKLRNTILKHILAKRDRRGEQIPRRFINRLLTQFQASTKRERISLGTALKELSDSLTPTQLRHFFDLQVHSEYALDRRRAYEIAPKIYSPEIDVLLWASWRTHHDDNCMSVLSDKSSNYSLTKEFMSIWHSPQLRFSIKNNVLKRVAKHDFSIVTFLKNEKSISYLSACVAANKKISDTDAIEIAKTADKLNSFQYALWCIGSLGMREALAKLLAEALKIESSLPTEFWEANPYYDGTHDLPDSAA